MSTNVLLTSVGRRSYLARYFREALRGQGVVIGANMYADAPGMYAVDVPIVTPPADSKEYVPTLLEICKRYNVKLLASLHDLDVFVLSQHTAHFREIGVTAIVPSAEWGVIALDKYASTNLLRNHGFDVPWTSTSLEEATTALKRGDVDVPLVVKARAGFGSLGLSVCHTTDDLEMAYRSAEQAVADSSTDRFLEINAHERVIIQPFLRGRELCIGIVNDLNGHYRTHFVCEVHSMRAGESDMATSLPPDIVGDLPRKLSALTRHPGIWGLDCIQTDSRLEIIDLNPRFSGDYPFHHLAGANVPSALISWVNGREPDPSVLRTQPGIRGFKEIVPMKIPELKKEISTGTLS